MTEAEWLACDDPWVMLRFVSGKAGERKLRLYACACCRAAHPRGFGPVLEATYAVTESYADGEVDLDAVRGRWGGPAASPCWPERPAAWALDLSRTRSSAQRVRRAGYARCIFGDTFRPASARAVGVVPGVAALAWPAYEQRTLPSGHLDNARLAVLSDALEEAGCTDADLLAHLRSPGPHVRGCWPLDLVLGKA
jgi:hypothetical protein